MDCCATHVVSSCLFVLFILLSVVLQEPAHTVFDSSIVTSLVENLLNFF
jgi:hypothetical protein